MARRSRALPGSRHAELVNLACKSAILNRGVSQIIFPDEVPKMPALDGVSAGSPEGRVTPLEIAPPEESVDRAVELLENSKRPVRSTTRFWPLIRTTPMRCHLRGLV